MGNCRLLMDCHGLYSLAPHTKARHDGGPFSYFTWECVSAVSPCWSYKTHTMGGSLTRVPKRISTPKGGGEGH